MFDASAAVDVADRRIGEHAVRDRINRFVRGRDFAAAHSDVRDNAVHIACFDSVAEPERAVCDNDNRSEKVGDGILRRQSDRQSDDACARQQSRDIQMKNVLPDEQDGRNRNRYFQCVPDHADRQVVERVVVPLRKLPDFPVHHGNQPENSPGDDQSDRRIEKTHIHVMQIPRQAFQNRKEKQEAGRENSQQNHRCGQHVEDLPPPEVFLPVDSILSQAAEEPCQEHSRQNRDGASDQEVQQIVTFP